MHVTNYFIIGKTTMPSSWIALIVAFVIAYVVIRLRYGKNISELLLDSIFYFVIVWKLSVILTDFGHVVKSPLSILYFHGGLVGFYLGLFAAAVRILVELKTKGLPWIDRTALFISMVTIQAVYQVMMVLLNEGALIVKLATVVLFISVALFVWIVIGKINRPPAQLALLFIAVHLFTASFQPVGLLGTAVLTTILMSLFSVLFLFKGHDTE